MKFNTKSWSLIVENSKMSRVVHDDYPAVKERQDKNNAKHFIHNGVKCEISPAPLDFQIR